MADAIKILGQLAAAATTEETLYTVPNLTQTTVSTLVVANRSAGAVTFRVSVAVAGAVTDNSQYLFYDTSLAANSTLTATIGITLGQNDVVRTYAASADLTFNLFGVETS